MYKKFFIIIGVFLASTVYAPPVFALVCAQVSTGLSNDAVTYPDGSNPNGDQYAMPFTVSSSCVPTALIINAGLRGSPGYTFLGQIESDAAGVPSGSTLLTATISTAGSGLSGVGPTSISSAFSGSYTLVPSTDYWIVFTSVNGSDGSNNYRIWGDSSASGGVYMPNSTWVYPIGSGNAPNLGYEIDGTAGGGGGGGGGGGASSTDATSTADQAQQNLSTAFFLYFIAMFGMIWLIRKH